MPARHTIWKLAGIADDWWGRIKVLAFLMGLVTTALLAIWAFLIRDLGALGIVVLSTAAGFGLLTSLLALEIWRPERRAIARDEAGTEGTRVASLDLAVEFGQQAVALPLDPAQPEVGRYFWIHNVTITNRSPERRVSLVPSLAIELENGNHVLLEQKGVPVVPTNFTGQAGLLEGPLDLDPSRSCRGDFGFPLFGMEEQNYFGGDFQKSVKRLGGENGAPIIYFVLRDLVSGEEDAREVTYPKMQRPAGPLSLRELIDLKEAQSRKAQSR